LEVALYQNNLAAAKPAANPNEGTYLECKTFSKISDKLADEYKAFLERLKNPKATTPVAQPLDRKSSIGKSNKKAW
jgi:hypothetical protein